jgi:hypothetical protein
LRKRTGSTRAHVIRPQDFEEELSHCARADARPSGKRHNAADASVAGRRIDTRLNMGQTTLTAHLPTVDVEITRHELPERNAEAMTIRIIATPSFDAAAQWLLQTALFPVAPPFSLWADFIQVWQRAWYPVWQPWLPADSPLRRSIREPE